MLLTEGYETQFGLAERPFSLTPDPKYYFRSHSHSRAFDALSAGIARGESLLLVTGDLGVGKTTLCRTLVDLFERKSRAVLVGNALLSPEDLLRLLLQDLGAISKDEVQRGRLTGVSREDLQQRLDEFLLQLRSAKDGAVLIVDDAHCLPASTVDLIVSLASTESNREKALQVLLAGQLPANGVPAVARPLEERLSTRVRLVPIERDECARYITHRLSIAGGADITFAARAVEGIYALSGGVPRLVNLLCERALQEGAAQGSGRIDESMVESAASALELLRLKTRRFRWFGAHAR